MQSSHIDDDIVEEDDDDEDAESNLRDSESTQSTNPVMKSTSERHSDEPQEKSSSADTVNSAGLFHSVTSLLAPPPSSRPLTANMGPVTVSCGGAVWTSQFAFC